MLANRVRHDAPTQLRMLAPVQSHPLETFCKGMIQSLHGIPGVVMVRIVYHGGQPQEWCTEKYPDPLRAMLTELQLPLLNESQPHHWVITQAGSKLWIYYILISEAEVRPATDQSGSDQREGSLSPESYVQIATDRVLDPQAKQWITTQYQLLKSHLALYELNQSQQTSIALLENMIRRISHQLYHPLARISLCVENIRWSLQDLVFPPLPTTQVSADAEHLWAAQHQAHQAAHQLTQEQINSIARTTEGLGSCLQRLVMCGRGTDLQREEHEMGSLLAQSIAELSSKAAARQVTIHQQGSPAWGSVDAFLLSQALENLLGNAIEFSPPGGEILCTCHRLGTRMVITIADQGPGLSPEALRSAFTAFYSSRPQGTGLGLTIAQKIVTDHNGLLWAENRSTGGAQFSISLPMSN